jgi:hypothetical protein
MMKSPLYIKKKVLFETRNTRLKLLLRELVTALRMLPLYQSLKDLQSHTIRSSYMVKLDLEKHTFFKQLKVTFDKTIPYIQQNMFQQKLF